MYEYTKSPKQLTKYNLFKGITDFGNVIQFNTFDSGRPYLVMLDYPRFLSKLKSTDDNVATILENAFHILEYEFKGLDGIEDITSEAIEINNGIDTLQLHNKTIEQSASTITMTYTEKTGSPLTKMCELFLKGIMDSRSNTKTYYGLIDDGILEDGAENEIFTFLYWITDTTGKNVERAYLLLAAQPTKAPTNIYNGTKGENGVKEISLEFRCFVASGDYVDQLATEHIDTSLVLNSQSFEYTI